MKRIAYIQYTNPALYPPLEHSSQILADKGWQVLFLGIGGLRAGAYALRFAEFPGVRVRQLGYCPPGWRQKLHYFWYAVWATGWVLAWRPAWIYVSDLLACPIGLFLSYLPFRQVIYHEHDAPVVTDRRSAFLRIAFWARRRVARRAALCILPHADRANRFASETGTTAPVICVWNCPDRDEALSQPRPPLNGSDLWVHYHGNLGPPLLPVAVVAALARLPERVKLCVIGYETTEGYVRQLQQAARQFGVAQRVEFVGPLSRAKLLERCRSSHVGLALMPVRGANCNEQAMAGASNKAFEYLACGLALLVSNVPEWQAMYVDAGVGLACDPDAPASIAAALQWFLDHPDAMRDMGERGRRRILEEWNYEREFEPVIEVLTGTEP
ncbi:MAG TPA: glycosyltransferase [Verrucomicrobiae bacterium]|nr:glycosyltransferase [Verrucomicrobiae bacterium]